MQLEKHYSNERNAQIIIALLKAYNIKKVVASPGSTNISFVGSVQNDPFFEVYSWVDERSAAYVACGIAEETGEPVVLSCTGATASRNYMSGLTEAYYRKLPIIAITSTHEQSMVGNLIPQVIDRNSTPNDICVYSVLLRTIKDDKDEWDCQIKANRALDALFRNGGGPVHVNLETANAREPFSVKEITGVKVIKRNTIFDELPSIPQGRIGIFVASHPTWSDDLRRIVEKFCELYNATVFVDVTSGYNGKYRVPAAILGAQDAYRSQACDMDLVIYIGELSGSYESFNIVGKTKEMWRVNTDGGIKDPQKKLSRVFDMTELQFFSHYIDVAQEKKNTSFFETTKSEYERLVGELPELPLSNHWIAKTLSGELPDGSEIHVGILNSFRAWSFFMLPDSVRGFCNVGGFGIDGCVSSMIGASLCNKNKLYYGVFGDLAFMYDMNVLCNRHVGNNIRILLVNNGKGVEFRNYTHQAALWGEDADRYIAAGGHFGQQSRALVKHFAEDLGFAYLKAESKEDFLSNMSTFLNPKIGNKPILMEVFTETEDEVDALFKIRNAESSVKQIIKKKIVETIKDSFGESGVNAVKKVLGK